MDPNSPLAYYLIGHSATVSSKHQEAIAALEESARRFGDPFSLSYLAMAYGFASESAKAREVIARLEATAASRHVPPICLAWASLDFHGESGACNFTRRYLNLVPVAGSTQHVVSHAQS